MTRLDSRQPPLCGNSCLFHAPMMYKVTKKCDASFCKLDASLNLSLSPQAWLLHQKHFHARFTRIQIQMEHIFVKYRLSFRNNRLSRLVQPTLIRDRVGRGYRCISIQSCGRLSRDEWSKSTMSAPRFSPLDNRCQTDPRYLFKRDGEIRDEGKLVSLIVQNSGSTSLSSCF